MIQPSPALNRSRAAAKVILAALAIAATIIAITSFFWRQIDARRSAQLKVIRLDSDVTKALADFDCLLLGEKVEGMAEDLDRMNASLDAVVRIGLDDTNPMLKSHRRFRIASDEERAAIRANDVPRARRLSVAETRPAFEKFKGELKAWDRELASELRFWVRLSRATTWLCLLLSAGAVAGLILRFRSHIESTVVRELQQKSVEASERRLRSLIQNNSDVIALVTAEGVVTMVSDACEATWGETADALVGRSVFDLIEPGDASRVRRLFDESVLPDPSPVAAEGKVARADGTVKEFELRFANLLDDPDVAGVLLTFHDLTERKRFEAELTHHAFHDRLTGLPNRALFLDRLTHRLKARELDGVGFAALFIDLDNFKVINDSLGHEAGDRLLIEVAARLQSVVRPIDTVARMGGDEFTVILSEARDAAEATEVGERILRALVMPLALGEREVFVTCSIGVVMASDSAPDAAGLLRDADTAMYQAKGNGKAGVTVFEPSMNLQAVDRMELESDLRAAIEGGQFFLAYQPIVDMETGRLRDVEALIRWQHPVRGVVSPLAFIPLAEETGLICAIGRWAFRQACEQLARWNEGLEESDRLRISVNVSGRQLQERGFVAEVKGVLEELGLDPRLVELEVTETAMLNDLAKMKGVFADLRKIGFRIAIDDFGTGYSSMAYLSHLPVDTLKIDRSFVIPLSEDDRAVGVVQAMITMAHTLGLGITGEGVETEDQMKALQRMGCDLGQGYLFDRPLTAESVSQLLAQPERRPFTDALPMAA